MTAPTTTTAPTNSTDKPQQEAKPSITFQALTHQQAMTSNNNNNNNMHSQAGPDERADARDVAHGPNPAQVVHDRHVALRCAFFDLFILFHFIFEKRGRNKWLNKIVICVSILIKAHHSIRR